MTIKEFFQKPYDWFKNWQPPAWLKKILQEVNDLMMILIKEAGKAYIDYLKAKIIEAAQHNNWTSREKFDYVFKEAKKGFVEFGITLKDSTLNTLINYFVSQLKQDKVIK